MEQFIQYAPILILILMFLFQTKIFVRSEDLVKLETKITDAIVKRVKEAGFLKSEDFQESRADFEKHIAENYVSKEVYFYNHDEMKKQMDGIQSTVNKINDKIDEKTLQDSRLSQQLLEYLVKKNN